MSDKKSNSKAAGKDDPKAKGSADHQLKDKEAEAGKEGGKSGTAVVDLGFLEADDDFEEFPAEAWKSTKQPGEKDLANGVNGQVGATEEEDAEANIWEDNWDDDNIEEDFSKQLK